MKQAFGVLEVICLLCAFSLIECGKMGSGKMMLLCTAVESPDDSPYHDKISTMRFEDSGTNPFETSTQSPPTYKVSLEPTTVAKTTSRTTKVESYTRRGTKHSVTTPTSTTLKRPIKLSSLPITSTTQSSLVTSTKKKRKKNKTIGTCPQGYVKDKRGVCRLTAITESPTKN